MDLATKLRVLKEMDDKNAAIDSAFLAGVQSVTPMREFTTDELRMLAALVNGHGELASRLYGEVQRRQELVAPYKTKKIKEAKKRAATDALEKAHQS
jgi:hypothetical protein